MLDAKDEYMKEKERKEKIMQKKKHIAMLSLVDKKYLNKIMDSYILKSPMRRIHKIKTKTVVKSTISDEGIERLRDNCSEIRDLAIIDLLYSTGIRVGELVNLNIDDIDLEDHCRNNTGKNGSIEYKSGNTVL